MFGNAFGGRASANGSGAAALLNGSSRSATPRKWQHFRDAEPGAGTGLGAGAVGAGLGVNDGMREAGRDRYGAGVGSNGDVQTIASFSVSSTGANENEDTSAPPPQWTQGTFSDPLYEKMREARQANVDYGLMR